MSVARRPYLSASPAGAYDGRAGGTPGVVAASAAPAVSRGLGMPNSTLMPSGYATPPRQTAVAGLFPDNEPMLEG